MSRMSLLLAAVTLLIGSFSVPADDKKPADELDGKWERVSQTVDGKAWEAGKLKGHYIVVKGAKVTYMHEDKEEGPAATLKLDPGKSPKHIDVTYTDGPNKGKTHKGIYKIDGDTATACFGDVGKDRPTKFASTPGSGTMLQTVKRVK